MTLESRQLPTKPNLRHLKDQAKDLHKSGDAESLSDAQFQIAKAYGFASWTRLKRQVEIYTVIDSGHLKGAADMILETHKDNRSSVGLNDAPADLTPMQIAAFWEPAAVPAMQAAGAELDLHSACAIGDTATIRSLAIDSAMTQQAEHMTPMGYAVRCGQPDAVRALLEAGDDPNRPLARIGFYVWEMHAHRGGIAKWVPLHGACAHGYWPTAPDTIRFLLNGGADTTITSCLGEAPIHYAACHGWVASLDALHQQGVDLDMRTSPPHPAVAEMANPEGNESGDALTPLMIAVREGLTDAVAYLVQHVDLAAVDTKGLTALHVAAKPWWRENIDVVKLLLAAGADPGSIDSEGRRPLDLANKAGYANTAKLLA
ncbi:MAG: ankyrin repeat domain-containing protein [Pseudomonadota bacterium]